MPDSTPPGPLLPRVRLYQQGEAIAARTSAGRTRGDLYLRPVWSPGSPPDPGQQGPLQLAGARVESLTPERLAVTLDWAVGDPIPANHKVALRLRDPAGSEWAALDTQPGYGFYPTGLWQPGTSFGERLVLPVDYGLPPGEYALSVALYDAVTLVPAWGPEERQVTVSTAVPYDGRPLVHRFSPTVAAAGVTMTEALVQGDRFSSVSYTHLTLPTTPYV